jgi:pyruvate dehydrogenase E2 component (dihydrolipoamide acetyltransferase)
MPALSPTMEKGNLAKWLVAEGDLVRPGDPIAEIETDKVSMELESVDAGRIARLLVAEGTENVAVGAVIALLAVEGKIASEPALQEAATAICGPVEAAPSLLPVMAYQPEQPTVRPPRLRTEQIKASPLARRIATARGIALADIAGTGPDGLILRKDVGIAAPAPIVATPSVSAEPIDRLIPPPAGVPVETQKLSLMRRTIAQRLSVAKQTVPHFYLTARCRLDPLQKLRGNLNGSLGANDVKVSVNDMMMKAMALALVKVPDANVQFGGGVLHRFSRVDISMAVAIGGGLVTPVIRDVASLSVSAISNTSKALTAKARAGRLAPEDIQGGTVSISNLGMYGIDEMIPVINPPQALILGIGAAVEQPWMIDGRITPATIMAATVSVDHRAIDGVIAARFLAALREIIEDPVRIIG